MSDCTDVKQKTLGRLAFSCAVLKDHYDTPLYPTSYRPIKNILFRRMHVIAIQGHQIRDGRCLS